MAIDLSELEFVSVPDPTGSSAPFVSIVYNDENGREFTLGLGIQDHGGQLMAVRFNASPSDMRDLMVMDASDDRILIL